MEVGMSHDSWKNRQSFYLADFRVPLDEVAKVLMVSNRFNRKKECAELVDDWGVFVSVAVFGAGGTTESAEVTSKHPLQLVTKALLENALSPCVVTFEVVA